MSSTALLCAWSLCWASMHLIADSISLKYCFTDCCAARMSCSVAVDGSGKLVGAFGPWQLSARQTVAPKVAADATINRASVLGMSELHRPIARAARTHEPYRPRPREI